jgi:hypothetical protein
LWQIITAASAKNDSKWGAGWKIYEKVKLQEKNLISKIGASIFIFSTNRD